MEKMLGIIEPIKTLDMNKYRNIIANSTAQHSTAQHSTAQHSTALAA